MSEDDIKTIRRLLKVGISPRKISDSTPYPYEIIIQERDKMRKEND